MQIYFSGRIIIHVPEPVHNLVQRYPGFRQEGCMRVPEYGRASYEACELKHDGEDYWTKNSQSGLV